jgi:hypothetical protein
MSKAHIIPLFPSTGGFAENKDIAAELRENEILPTLRIGKTLVLDFTGITNTTQSFVHALISEAIRENGIDVLDRMSFKSCHDNVKSVIGIVTDYMQYEEEEIHQTNA